VTRNEKNDFFRSKFFPRSSPNILPASASVYSRRRVEPLQNRKKTFLRNTFSQTHSKFMPNTIVRNAKTVTLTVALAVVFSLTSCWNRSQWWFDRNERIQVVHTWKTQFRRSWVSHFYSIRAENTRADHPRLGFRSGPRDNVRASLGGAPSGERGKASAWGRQLADPLLRFEATTSSW
jgi:hypothetical protein